MNNILSVLVDIASEPSILVALIAVLGLALQKSSLNDTIIGGIKTFVGFLILSAGAGVVSGALEPFGRCFRKPLMPRG